MSVQAPEAPPAFNPGEVFVICTEELPLALTGLSNAVVIHGKSVEPARDLIIQAPDAPPDSPHPYPQTDAFARRNYSVGRLLVASGYLFDGRTNYPDRSYYSS